MIGNEQTAERFAKNNSLIDELVTRMHDLEEKFRAQFNEAPMQQSLYEIIASVNKDQSDDIDPLKLCAIFTDFAESFLDRAFDYDKVLKQNAKLNNELHKANDLIRRLTDENEYHLSKLKYLAKQLEIYKDSWRGKLTEKSVERQISDLMSERDKEVEELKNKLANTEKEFVKFKFENRNAPLNNSHLNFDDSKNFNDLKANNISRSAINPNFSIDKLYGELSSMDRNQLIEY